MASTKYFFSCLFSFIFFHICAAQYVEVCADCEVKSIQQAVDLAKERDTILIKDGLYKEHDITIKKSISIIGEKQAVVDGEDAGTIFHVSADHFRMENLTIINVGKSYTKDFAAILLSKSENFVLRNITLKNIFFGMLIEKSNHGIIEYNTIISDAKEQAGSGNGIHLWHCDDVQVNNNAVTGVRDGIYFEFVSNSKVFNNKSVENLRYGLHFMFSNNDSYYNNTFSKNGAGVAVMFSKFIHMENNVFIENWGSASYGLLLKEIYDTEIINNRFEQNTMGVSVDGSTRVNFKENTFIRNGWAVNVIGACYDNKFYKNNFMHNSFDLSYNGKLNSNEFDQNYWSDYTGYDLDENGIGDVPYRPVKLFSYIVNRSPETIVLLRSLFVDLINFSEKVSPVFTPDNLIDQNPLMKANK
jgi:nitrous oxidase accessory protein